MGCITIYNSKFSNVKKKKMNTVYIVNDAGSRANIPLVKTRKYLTQTENMNAENGNNPFFVQYMKGVLTELMENGDIFHGFKSGDVDTALGKLNSIDAYILASAQDLSFLDEVTRGLARFGTLRQSRANELKGFSQKIPSAYQQMDFLKEVIERSKFPQRDNLITLMQRAEASFNRGDLLRCQGILEEVDNTIPWN